MSHTPTRVSVLGAGTMGRWIAYLFALGGCVVYLIEKNAKTLATAKDAHLRLIKLDRRDPGEQDQVLGRIHYVQGEVPRDAPVMDALREADYIIEAVPEQRELKQTVLTEVSNVAKPTAIIASNTSAYLMSELDGGCRNHRGRTLNLHYFPEPRRAVELMAGTDTEFALLEEVAAFLKQTGFIPFLVKGQRRGFIFNYLWHLVKMGALQHVMHGTASHEDVDRLWILNFGMAYGPFAIMDMVGLDVVLDVARIYHEEDPARNHAPPPFLVEWVAAGRLGMKSGEGFYKYPNPSYARADWLTGEVRLETFFVGTWELTSFVTMNESGVIVGHPMGEDAEGCLTYTATGQMSVCLSRANRANFAVPHPLGGTAEEMAQAFRDFLSYFGAYRIEGQEVVHSLAHCSFPNWKGSEQRRKFELKDGTLILDTPLMSSGSASGGGEQVLYRLVWKKKC